jgi:hypothetical protein
MTTLDRPDRLRFIIQHEKKAHEEVIALEMEGHTEVISYSSRRRMEPIHSTVS